MERSNAASGAELLRRMAKRVHFLDDAVVEDVEEETGDVDEEMKALMEEAPQSRGSKSEVFLLTVFKEVNPCEVAELRSYCRYIKAQLEIAPTTGKLHWQTIIVLKKRDKWSIVANRVEEIFGMRVFVQPVSSKSSGYTRALKYCGKKETRANPDAEPSEYGEWPFKDGHGQGKRTDIEGAYQFALEHPLAGQREFAEAGYLEPWVKYPRLLGVQIAAVAETELPAPVAFWFWGPTGTGKTHRARLLAKSLCSQNAGWKTYTRKTHDRNEWPGYTGQEVVIWDEFREVSPHQSLGALLTILDRGNPTYLNQKYSGVYLMAKVHIFTAPTRPEEAFYHGIGVNQGNIDQLVRRITPDRVVHCAVPYVYRGEPEPTYDADACLAGVLAAHPVK